MAAGVEYTIDELARAAGTTVRSLRVYHERGVLPPPEVRGRTGFYGADHLNRVHTIGRLLDRGIKLNGIRELLEAWDRGDDLGDILGVANAEGAHDTEPSSDETIAATELERLYGDVPHGLARVVSLGLYEPVDAANYRIADRDLVHVVGQLTTVGIPTGDVLGELERLRVDCDRVARRVVELFHRTALVTFRESERGSQDLATLTEQLVVTRAVAAKTTAELVDRFVARYLEGDTDLTDILSGA
ncbi:MerR family transcriptional regulator [Nocardia sp. NEAU-G5]|uniref:MerR family transcriptional regulator n=1 Tax=Nocardia albiluteola TaxID=2842303 RepID=A0ABS6B964_9NOCA|nr:MerR family transcriptional regulator [Nocardia albiluteola]